MPCSADTYSDSVAGCINSGILPSFYKAPMLEQSKTIASGAEQKLLKIFQLLDKIVLPGKIAQFK